MGPLPNRKQSLHCDVGRVRTASSSACGRRRRNGRVETVSFCKFGSDGKPNIENSRSQDLVPIDFDAGSIEKMAVSILCEGDGVLRFERKDSLNRDFKDGRSFETLVERLQIGEVTPACGFLHLNVLRPKGKLVSQNNRSL